MRHLTLITLLSAAGIAACSSNPLGPTQASASKTAAAAAGSALAPAGTAVTPTGIAVAPAGAATAPAGITAPPTGSPSDCVQDGENTGECGDQTADGTETPGTEVPEAPGAPELP